MGHNDKKDAKPMYKRLYRLALLTSPILAIYGVAPIIIFERIEIKYPVLLVLIAAINVFIFWQINIFLLKKLGNGSKIRLYLVSFILVFITHIPKIWLDFLIPLPFVGFIEKYIVYPVILTLAIDVIIWIIINSVILSEKTKEAEIRIEQLNTQNLEAQKHILLQQLQPHFLFNALNTLKSLIPENAELAENYTLELSNFLRYSMQAKDHEMVKLSDELQFTQDFINLQKVRFGDAIQCEIDLPVSLMDKKIPVYALQTLVENAMKHNSFSDSKVLNINISSESDKVVVNNNRYPKKLNLPSGVGLLNLNERYKLICSKEIEILKDDNQFVVKLVLI